MKPFKYNIGERLYIGGLSKKYKLANPFIVGKRKRETIKLKVDGEIVESEHLQYSPDPDEFAQVWYGEEALTKNVESGAY